jgi:putative transcriptional regulator
MTIELKNKIVGYRKMLNFSQQDMANQLHISKQSYWNKENGKVPFNDAEKIIIRDMFHQINADLTIDELFFYSKSIQK